MKTRIFLLILAMSGFAMASNMSYKDEIKAEATYCNNVFSGIHPDYKQLLGSTCNRYKVEP